MSFERAGLRRSAMISVVIVAALGVLSTSACAPLTRGREGPTAERPPEEPRPGLFSQIFPKRRVGPGAQTPDAGSALGVNAFLWRATLDTLSFMPLASADPYSGLIITDWYANPEKPDERFKATVYILDTRLRADGLNVALARQTRVPGADWTDASVAADTEEALENAILTRARQLRVSGR